MKNPTLRMVDLLHIANVRVILSDPYRVLSGPWLSIENDCKLIGGQGILLAYQIARDNYIVGGTNRVILCSDGVANVGQTGPQSIWEVISGYASEGITLTSVGFGMGNYKDAMLEKISNRGDGNYAYIDSIAEARRVLVEQRASTLVTVAKDAKLQIEFNPALVGRAILQAAFPVPMTTWLASMAPPMAVSRT